MNISNKENYPNLGYVIWPKVPRACFEEMHPKNISGFRNWTKNTIRNLRDRRVTHIRLGVPWAECFSLGGKECVHWYLKEFGSAGFDILPCLCFTPPALSINGKTNGPPREPAAFALHCYEVIRAFRENGYKLTHIEIWNEFTMNTDWHQAYDPDFSIFADMVTEGCIANRHYAIQSVLGGMAGVDSVNLQILQNLYERGLMQHIDVVGFHALRGTWSDHTPPPSIPDQAKRITNVTGSDKVWMTEYGFPTAGLGVPRPITQQHLEEIQVALYADALMHLWNGCQERIYWYALRDCTHPSLRAIHEGWEDRLQHHMGDSYRNGRPKLLGKLLLAGGPCAVVDFAKKKLNVQELLEEASLKRTPPHEYIRGSATALAA